jgi:hypothetical protein
LRYPARVPSPPRTQYCPPNGWSADFNAPVAGVPATPKAGSCSVKFSSTLMLYLDCSKLSISLDTIDVYFNVVGRRRAASRRRLLFCGAAPGAAAALPSVVTPQGDHLQMWLTLTSKDAKGSVALSAAAPLP